MSAKRSLRICAAGDPKAQADAYSCVRKPRSAVSGVLPALDRSCAIRCSAPVSMRHTHGTHQFRHGLATEMLREGASLAEIGEVLGHRHPQTTTIYAKIDINALRTRYPGPEVRDDNAA